MVCCQYAESKNNPFDGTRQTGDCCHQSVLRTYLRQRGDPFCLEQSVERGTAVHSTPLQQGTRLISLGLEATGFYAAV